MCTYIYICIYKSTCRCEQICPWVAQFRFTSSHKRRGEAKTHRQHTIARQKTRHLSLTDTNIKRCGVRSRLGVVWVGKRCCHLLHRRPTDTTVGNSHVCSEGEDHRGSKVATRSKCKRNLWLITKALQCAVCAQNQLKLECLRKTRRAEQAHAQR